MKKSIKLSVIAVSLFVAYSCNNKVKNEVKTLETVSEFAEPNESDVHFDIALKALESDKFKIANSELGIAIASLIKEGANLTGKSKSALESSIKTLTNIKSSYKNNKSTNINYLKETILKAELAVGHDYLITDDIYVLTEPYKVNDKTITDNFSTNMKVLENTNSDLKGEGDNMREDLYREGVEFQKQYSEWLLNVGAHNKKANAYLQNEFILNTNIE